VRRSEMAANIAGEPAGDAARAATTVAQMMPYALPAVTFLYLKLFRHWPGQMVVLPVCGALIGGAALRAVVLRLLTDGGSARGLTGVALSLPTVVAHGHCGACGYRVADVPCGTDGFHTCAECGAEWHRERMVSAGLTPTDRVAALRRTASLSRQGDSGWFDDRGVGLSAAYRWPRGLLRSVTPPHAADARTELNRRLGLAVRIFVACVWAVAAGLWTVFAVAWGRRSATTGELAGWGIGLAVMAGVVHILARMARMQAPDVRATVLMHGLCPSCWTVIRGSRVEFDGCVTCTGCRAAWRM